MTDTPSPGAGANARVHGSPDALAQVDVAHLSRPLPLSSANAEALLGPPPPPSAPPAKLAHEATGPAPAPVSLDTVVIEGSALKPQLLSLLRWLIMGSASG